MNQSDYFFGYFFETAIPLKEADFFGIWVMNFRSQLKDLHQNLEVEEEDGIIHNFKAMDFTDFCLLIYTDRSDLIDIPQN